MKAKTRSPLKDKPLRYVAQSGDEAIEDLLYDKVLWHYSVVIIFAMILGYEWLRYYKPLTKPPILLTLLVGVLCAYSIFKFVRHLLKLKHLKLGRNGERVVGQYLEEFRDSGCRVFHDIVGDSFNVDHVVISNKGIYVIETKTYSKPESGRANINYDGQKILINGKKPLTDIIVQVNAASSYIKKIIYDHKIQLDLLCSKYLVNN